MDEPQVSWDGVPTWNGDKCQSRSHKLAVELTKEAEKHRLLISLTVRDPQRSLARPSSGRTYSAADTDTRDGVRQERDGVAGGVKLPNSLERVAGMVDAKRESNVLDLY